MNSLSIWNTAPDMLSVFIWPRRLRVSTPLVCPIVGLVLLTPFSWADEEFEQWLDNLLDQPNHQITLATYYSAVEETVGDNPIEWNPLGARVSLSKQVGLSTWYGSFSADYDQYTGSAGNDWPQNQWQLNGGFSWLNWDVSLGLQQAVVEGSGYRGTQDRRRFLVERTQASHFISFGWQGQWALTDQVDLWTSPTLTWQNSDFSLLRQEDLNNFSVLDTLQEETTQQWYGTLNLGLGYRIDDLSFSIVASKDWLLDGQVHSTLTDRRDNETTDQTDNLEQTDDWSLLIPVSFALGNHTLGYSFQKLFSEDDQLNQSHELSWSTLF